jgi:plastocyanin
MFNTKSMMIGAVLLAITAGCATTLPTTTRTGSIHEVKFEERMTPTNLRIAPGDEVRWINQRSEPVTVEFLGSALGEVSCERGFADRSFANPMGRIREETTIQPNDSVSLCFTTVGTVTYNARMQANVAGGETIESGTIRVGQ